MELAKAISALLFYQAEPITVKRLSGLLKRSEEEIRDAIASLPERFKDTGIMLVQNGDEITLGTASEASSLIESITKEELSKDLSKSALETLAIVLYKGPITRSEIDYIRGVNSTFILRNLLIRGLVEKVDNPNDQRSFLYKPTFQLLEYMGVPDVKDLPDYHDTLVQLGSFVAIKQEEEKTEGTAVSAPLAIVPDDSTDIADTARAMELSDEELIEEADIAEEDEAGGGYDDPELRAHTDADRPE
ncbi:MAG: SMC-Scp complex subunit ScpB [Candidatus Lloydbacteria bacterium RIFCSPHIGHO2_01_FULL_49_22]|uniref:SMC-Scp complex subunit ScpB n=1 Tax=Candidatus Lloydbacteria bacterium RIFCSPHIGHO2_01_FULL_49_22 TaxID=1798658 RepID=A0A1G2CXB4_9BACT|nr:MAG: SMC-Scp complex subunit ScpB [Candidatus Lloydbacteria bacterium RIFCSPHIGHO2_01_FULL_49_22]OGZ10300.1 MAG: SMC-Scp complex subunit ScpB [Candidatus Lloydbacteria bacterium RIFCSPHIGHO2_02_FULL_50_18]